jgi:hypothetical protein
VHDPSTVFDPTHPTRLADDRASGRHEGWAGVRTFSAAAHRDFRGRIVDCVSHDSRTSSRLGAWLAGDNDKLGQRVAARIVIALGSIRFQLAGRRVPDLRGGSDLARGLLRKAFSREAIYEAICGYLLIRAAFGHMFYCADWLAPTDFSQARGQAIQSYDERSKQALFTYFSFAALTGVNDSDLTPRASAGRSLVLLEAVLGQFYVVMVISELITLRMSNMVPGGPSRD